MIYFLSGCTLITHYEMKMAISCDLNAYILDPRRLHQKSRIAKAVRLFYAPKRGVKFLV